MSACPPQTSADDAGTQCSITLLDGGMGHLLKQWGVQIPGLPYDQQFLAGCLANEVAPGQVRRAHGAYHEAGCTAITTNNFVATEHSLGKVQRQADVCSLVAQAGRLARDAASAAAHQVLVAGCLPPLQESYQTTGLPSPDSMRQQYAAIAAALLPHVDVFLSETLSTAAEAHAALQAAAQVAADKPVWVSFSLEDSTACRLRDEQPLAAVLQELVQQHANLRAVLVNCCAPAAVTAAIPVLKQTVPPGVRVGCYANGFKTTTTQWLRGSPQGLLEEARPEDYDADGLITPDAYLRHARDWVAAGAQIVGGCCGIGPQHMQLLSQQLAGRKVAPLGPPSGT